MRVDNSIFDRDSDTKLGKVFSWLTRYGMGPRFGSRPIAYYQQEQCAAIDYLQECLRALGAAETADLRIRSGIVYYRSGGKLFPLTTVSSVRKAGWQTLPGMRPPAPQIFRPV